MILGVTATRQGLTILQRKAMKEQLLELDPEELHHGRCIGGDTDIHGIWRLTLGRRRVVGHPCDLEDFQNPLLDCDELMPELPPLMRNGNIVRRSDEMIACPAEIVERKRGSGTWATIREAERQGKRCRVILPGGDIWVR